MKDMPMMVEREMDINGYDIDVMGIVSNIVYVRWFEDLRNSFLDKYYPYTEMIEQKMSPILMKTKVEYKKSLTIFDHPIGRTWMIHMGRSKWEMAFEIISRQTIHCYGEQTGCFYNLEKKRPARIPHQLLIHYNEEAEE